MGVYLPALVPLVEDEINRLMKLNRILPYLAARTYACAIVVARQGGRKDGAVVEKDMICQAKAWPPPTVRALISEAEWAKLPGSELCAEIREDPGEGFIDYRIEATAILARRYYLRDKVGNLIEGV